jgi:FtsZ-interacting cell division protein ZipA
MNYQVNESELLYNRSSNDSKASYNYDQTFSKSKDGINDFNNMKNLKYSYPGHTSVESKEPATRSKPAGAESRYSDDVLVTNKNTQEKFGTYTLASNREYPKDESKKPSYEEKAKQYYQEARKADNTKDSRGAPGSISEIVDTNKVKTSKLFQKFLQNENKENPKKTSQNDNSRQSPSPPRQQPKEQNKSKTPPPALSRNQPSRQEKVPAQGKNPYLKERNIPNLDLIEGSMQYVKGSKCIILTVK